jgi:hypothetical protein
LYPARAFAALADILECELPLAAAPGALGWGIVHTDETIAPAPDAQILECGFPFSAAPPALNLSSIHLTLLCLMNQSSEASICFLFDKLHFVAPLV